MSTRAEQIQQTLATLESFKGDPAYADRRYAIDANIRFLEAARSLPRYFWWLLTVAPKLDGSRLLELTDFPVEEWDIAMHERLIELEKRERPGLITPLVHAITDYVKKESRDLVLANLGAGGMEVDRQVLEWALQTGHPYALTIVAVDKSPITRRIADRNLHELKNAVEIIETGELKVAELESLRKGATKKILVVMCTNDVFELDSRFNPGYFDLVYHSLFRHHLDMSGKGRLEQITRDIGKKRYEFDGYKSWAVVLPQTIVGWNFPCFLNGELFSNMRFDRVHDIQDRISKKGEVHFYGPTGFYLMEYY